MAYTTQEQVRLHVLASLPVREAIIQQELQVSGSGWITFHNGPVLNETIRLSSRHNSPPSRFEGSLLQGTLSLPVPALQRDSVLVASNSSLGIEYIENQDYVVDYDQAVLTGKSSGALQLDQSITVWYRQRRDYVADQDYQTDSAHGRLRRMSSGDIGDGEIVLLSYTPQLASFPDDIIAQATDEANQFIAAAIDPNREFGANPHLALAATYHAVALICRIAATRDLIAGTGTGSIASAWLSLADTHQQLSRDLIDSFRPPVTRPNQPRAV